jgi:hypothetical protein
LLIVWSLTTTTTTIIIITTTTTVKFVTGFWGEELSSN